MEFRANTKPIKDQKILFYVGEKVDLSTKFSRGIIKLSTDTPKIESSEGTIVLDDISHVEVSKLYKIGTMVKIKSNSKILFIAIPRFYIEIGPGFGVINYFATKKLAKLLK